MSKDCKACLALVFACSLFTWAHTGSPCRHPVQMDVTIGHHYGHVPPTLTPDDLIVTQHYEPLTVTSLAPLRGDRAGLEIFLLVDNYSNCEPGSKFEELSHFISSQPSTTTVGVAYIQDGRLKVAENPTTNHERAIQALSPPAGSKPASPFVALTDLIRGWPQRTSRRVVLMISNGVNPAATDAYQDPSAEAAIEAAQRAGVIVYVIYHPSADYLRAIFLSSIPGKFNSHTLRMKPAARPIFCTMDHCLL